MGLSYNTAVWAECRKFAAEFLREAHEKTGLDIFDNAIEQYSIVAKKLAEVYSMFPFEPSGQTDYKADGGKIDKAIEAIKTAREAEIAALAEIEAILTKL